MKQVCVWLLCFSLSWIGLIRPGIAANQTEIGTGNAIAIQLAQKSAIVQSARSQLIAQTKQIQNQALRKTTTSAIDDPKFCIEHRAGLTEPTKTKILQSLQDAGLVDSKDDATFPGGLKAGIFPPVLQDGSRCPQTPQPFFSAPGSAFGGHHSYPGGLVLHELFNDLSSQSFANLYRQLYGQATSSEMLIDRDLTIAAPLWHDWAKSIVFQWNTDGTEFAELNFGGNGTTDNNGQSGNSKTGSHHLIGLAESIKRKLTPELVITQASAHSAPTLGNEYKVVNWIRTAAIVAQVDPIEAGYLVRDAQNQLRLPPLDRLGELNLSTNLLAEYAIHNLSDADFVFSIPAVTIGEEILKAIAPEFGYRVEDTATFNTKFRNPVFASIPPERMTLLYARQGLNRVRSEVRKLSR